MPGVADPAMIRRARPAVGPPLRVALSVLLALVALLYVSTLVGLVTTGITDRLTKLQRGQSTVVERGHTLVLGWSEQTPTVVAELVAAHAQRRGGAVVVLADRDKAGMEEELRGAVPDPGRVRLLCRRGRPADPAALARVCPGRARAVLVLPPDGGGGGVDGDGWVVRTLLALRATVGDACPLRIVAAVRDAAFRSAAELAAGPGAVVLDGDDVAARLLVQCVREPGLAPVLEDLLDFAGAELHTLPVPEPAGRQFAALRAELAAACAVGLVRADGEVLLAPPGGTRLAAGDGLLVLAEDADAAALPGPVPEPDLSVVVTGVTPEQPVPRASRVLVLGWNRRAGAVLDLLVRSGAPGSVVDVLAADGTVPPPAAGASVAIRLHRGDPTAEDSVRRVDAGHDHVVVLGADDATDADRTLVTLLRLRARERATGRRAALVVELADDRDRPLMPVGPGADVVGTGRLLGLLMSQISQNGHLAAAFGELFSADGAAVGLRPAALFVRTGAEASFATVVESAGRRGACAIGYRTAAGPGAGADRRVRLNPAKSEVRRWGEGDEVIVVARGEEERS